MEFHYGAALHKIEKKCKSFDFTKEGQDLCIIQYQASNNISTAYWNVVHLFHNSTSAFWIYFSSNLCKNANIGISGTQ